MTEVAMQSVPVKDARGREVTSLLIWPYSEGAPVPVRVTHEEAIREGEEEIQLVENGRYLCRIETPGLVIKKSRCVTPQMNQEATAAIEPGDYCGQLVVQVGRPGDTEAFAAAAVEVRSQKLDYRAHYRWMMGSILRRVEGLLLDSRSEVRHRITPDTLKRDEGWERQLEYLRSILDNPRILAAVEQILRSPHRRLEGTMEVTRIGRPFKAGADLGRQLTKGGRRVAVPPGHRLPASHPLSNSGATLPAEITLRRRQDFQDTDENRFVKFALGEFKAWAQAATSDLEKAAEKGTSKAEDLRLASVARRLAAKTGAWLNRAWLPDISDATTVPAGSIVLQKRAGYREIFQAWLGFRAGIGFAWDGGADIYKAGARNVASLYEYWLFFELDALFRKKFSCPTPLYKAMVEPSGSRRRIRLKKGHALGETLGIIEAEGVRLSAAFAYNRQHDVSSEQGRRGSWTRRVQPDFTISIWPGAPADRDTAERNASMIHVHLDSKYRIEKLCDLMGNDDEERTEGSSPNLIAKYEDLMKMHAYRDAIRRSAGAFVLYPGNEDKEYKRHGEYHEPLPGLGAFGIKPRADGTAEGIEGVSRFLDEIIGHMAKKNTVRYGESFRVAESYIESGPYQTHAETWDADLGALRGRRVPESENLVLVTHYRDSEALDAARGPAGIYYQRLRDNGGKGWEVDPFLSRVTHILLRGPARKPVPGLLRVRGTGFLIANRESLMATIKARFPAWTPSWKAHDRGAKRLYAVFETCADAEWSGRTWDSRRLEELAPQWDKAKGRTLRRGGIYLIDLARLRG